MLQIVGWGFDISMGNRSPMLDLLGFNINRKGNPTKEGAKEWSIIGDGKRGEVGVYDISLYWLKKYNFLCLKGRKT